MEERRLGFSRIVSGRVLLPNESDFALESRVSRVGVARATSGGLGGLGAGFCGGRLGDLGADSLSRPHFFSISVCAARSPERNAPSM